MVEIRRCPFCGGEGKLAYVGGAGFVVRCAKCGIWNGSYRPCASGRTEDEFAGYVNSESAIRAWNRRAVTG